MKTKTISFVLVFAVLLIGGYLIFSHFFADKYEFVLPGSNSEKSVKFTPAVVKPEPAVATPEPSVVKPSPVLIKPTPVKLPITKGARGAKNLVESLTKALESQDGAVLKALEEKGLLKPEQATQLSAWVKENGLSKIEPVGTMLKGDKKHTRYRLVGKKGQDMIIDLEEPLEASKDWSVAEIKPVDQDVKPNLISNDSMLVAESFINAVRRGDMMVARSLTTGRGVSDATVAGLCMVFAEGGYSLRDNNPLRASFENADRAGYLVYLKGDKRVRPAHVGMEMARMPDKQWRLRAVALDSLLSNYEHSAGAEGGRYFPIVKNPKGGDSLALFFNFDDFGLTPRSLRQLSIVANLLKSSQRNLSITGHTDDIGAVSYNQKLSIHRARAVKMALIELGVKAEQISTQGMGMNQPRRAYANIDVELDEETIRAENRRAEIYLDFE